MHNIEYEVFDGNKSTRAISDSVLNTIAHSGDGYGTRSIRFLNEVCDNYDQAVELLDKKAEGQFYPGFAVRYRRRSMEITPVVKSALEKRDKIDKEYRAYFDEHSVHKRKSEFIGCPECGSKLANNRFRGERCPVCGADLRPQTTKDKLVWYEQKRKAADEAVRKAYNKNKVQATDWLVLYEWHS